MKIVKKGSSSPDVTSSFGGPNTSISETPFYQALEKLAKSANERMTLKSIGAKKGVEALTTLTDRNQILAASFRSNLTSGTLRFRADIPKRTVSKSQSNLHNLLLLDPSKVEIFRKNLDRRSGKELVRPFNEHILQILENTFTTGSSKAIWKNHIALRLKEDYLSGKQSSTKQAGQNRTKRPRYQDSTTTTLEDDLAPLSPKAKRLSAKTSVIPPP